MYVRIFTSQCISVCMHAYMYVRADLRHRRVVEQINTYMHATHTYIHIGLAREVTNIKGRKESLVAWTVLIIGVIAIGILSLFHLHCEACGTEHAHDH